MKNVDYRLEIQREEKNKLNAKIAYDNLMLELVTLYGKKFGDEKLWLSLSDLTESEKKEIINVYANYQIATKDILDYPDLFLCAVQCLFDQSPSCDEEAKKIKNMGDEAYSKALHVWTDTIDNDFSEAYHKYINDSDVENCSRGLYVTQQMFAP